MSRMNQHYFDVQQTPEYRLGWTICAFGGPLPSTEHARAGYADCQAFRAEGGDPKDALDAIGAS